MSSSASFNSTKKRDYLSLARRTIDLECRALADLVVSLDESFCVACEMILACQGRVIVMGMGKSGHIGAKIASTLASTGTPAFFVHPAEAGHGDVGMVRDEDVLLLLSYSGESEELSLLLPFFQARGIQIIGLTGNRESALAQASQAVLLVEVAQEACPLNLAPTSSSTATLAMGDALAVVLLEARGFTERDFARSHPSGRLGRRLTLKVEDLMHTQGECPVVKQEVSFADALIEMTAKALGCTLIVGEDDALIGIFTDGDVRRAVSEHHAKLSMPIVQLMTTDCKIIEPGRLAVDALQVMREHKISVLPVVASGELCGLLHINDILRARVA